MSVIIRMPGQPQQKLSIHDYCIDFRANDTKMIFLLDHSKIKFDARLYFKKEAGLYFPCKYKNYSEFYYKLIVM